MASIFRTSRTSAAAAARTLAQAQPARRSLASHAKAQSSEAASSSSSTSASASAFSSSSSSSSPSSSSSSSSSPSSSTSAATAPKWSRPIPKGKCAAYDEALAFISSQSASVRRQLEQVKADAALSAEEKQQSLERLTVASEVNDPKLRWEFEKTPEDLLDLNQPTIRYLRERAWKKTGPLDKLTERLRLQRVVPDAVGAIVPTVDVQIIIDSPEGPGIGDHTVQEGQISGDVHPGITLEQLYLSDVPTLRLTAFHPEERRYTLLMVDLDRPNPDGKLVAESHWLVTNIPLSATKPRLMVSRRDSAASPESETGSLGGDVVQPYRSPYPSKGTGKHRYVTLLLEQTAAAPEDLPHGFPLVPVSTPSEGFDIRGFIERNRLRPAGIHFFRSEWTERSKKSISAAWRQRSPDGHEEVWGTLTRRERKTREEPLTPAQALVLGIPVDEEGNMVSA